MLKKILGVYSAERPHWVGNAFSVCTLFSYGNHGALLSPFLLFGHAGPTRFEPAAVLLFLGGEPIDEPVVGHGPFVMNSQADIDQAIADFASGNFGRITS